MTTFYITKYALTLGIMTIEGEYYNEKSIEQIKPKQDFTSYYHAKEFFETLDEAMHNAEERRLAKIKSLKKSVQKLESEVIKVLPMKVEGS